MARTILFYALVFQGVYYLITAIWPLISLRTFMIFAGSKPDRFIFWTVDLLILAIASTLLFATVKGDLGTAAFLGIASTLTFIAVEAVYAGKISPWFWADFAVEVVILVTLAGSLLMLPR
ncbi:MAG: hypothetical protein ACYC56_01035 [Candidatus Aquicultor sp.]